MDDLYRELIIEHYKNPAYRGHLDPHDISLRTTTRSAAITSRLTFGWTDEQGSRRPRFDGHGCAISQASADLLVESVIGKSIEEVKSDGQAAHP